MRRIIALATLNLLALGALTAPAVAGLPLRIAGLVPAADRTSTLAVVVACGAIGASIGNPLFGHLSDRTRARAGRRPWLVVGAVSGALGCLGALLAPNVATIAIAWGLTQFCYNAMFAAASGLLADSVPERQRAVASGIFGAASFLGTLPALILVAVLPEHIAVIMLAVPTLTVVATTAIALRLRESEPTHAASEEHDAEGRQDPAIVPRATLYFVLLSAQRFVMQLAFSLLASFTIYFIAQRFALAVTAAAPVAALTTALGGAGIVLTALVVGLLTARTGRYAAVVVAAAIGLAAGAAIRALSQAPAGLWVSAAVAGIALGAFYAVDLAAALRIAPPRAAGRYLGFFNLAETLPQSIAPALGGALVALRGADPLDGGTDDFTTLYVIAGIIAAASLAFVPALAPVLRRRAITRDPVRAPR